MANELTLMAVHAHPDDEAIGTGGVLARYADEGLRTVLVTCTGGEVGEILVRGVELERPDGRFRGGGNRIEFGDGGKRVGITGHVGGHGESPVNGGKTFSPRGSNRRWKG